MKSNFFVFNLIFFVFHSFFPVFSEENSNFTKAFVINPNGLVLFKSKAKSREQVGTIQYGDEVLLSLAETEPGWLEIKKGSVRGFIPATEASKSDFIIFKELATPKYTLVQQEKILLYEKPLTDSGSILELEQFEIGEVIAKVSSQSKMDKKWIYIKTKNNQVGYMKGEVAFYDSILEAENAQKKKQLTISGYLLVTDPVYLKEPGVVSKDETFILKGASKKGEFLKVTESQEINKIRYYKAIMQNPSRYYKMQATPEDYSDSPFEAWISEKNGIYYSKSEFTRFTIENSKHKGNKSLFEEMSAKNSDLALNFSSVLIDPLGEENGKKKSDFSIVKLFEGYENSSGYGASKRVSFIIQKKNDKYKVFSGNIDDRGAIEMFDMDEDGIPEFYTHMSVNSMSRVAFTTPLFYGFIKGAYKEIPLPGNFLDNYTIKDNILYVDARDASNTKRVKLKYKYKNGKFIKIK